MLPGWAGLNPQLAAISGNPLLLAAQTAPAGTPLLPPQPPPRIAASAEEQARAAKQGPPEGRTKEGWQSGLAGCGAAAWEHFTKRNASRVAEQKELEKKVQAELAAEAARAKAEGDAAAQEAEDKKPRCFLHKKPNPKCKKCQAALQAKAAAEEKKEEKKEDAATGAESSEKRERQRTPFNLANMLKDQVLKSTYYKSLLDIKTMDNLVQEIVEYPDTLDLYNQSNRSEPSCFICQVTRIATLVQQGDQDDQLYRVTENKYSAQVRCCGLLYLRYVTAPIDLVEVFDDYLLDDMPVRWKENGMDVDSTIGEYVESLLVKEKYFDTPLPRIPVKIRQNLEEKLAPYSQYRKRMAANRNAIRSDNVADMFVEVNVDGRWVPGQARSLIHGTRAKVQVSLEGGHEVRAPLGKVVISGPGGESDGERERDSRSPDRGGGRSRKEPNWSRYKGKSDSEMVEDMRARLKDNAVCHGKTYAKRPLTWDASMSSTAFAPPVVLEDARQEGPSSRRRRTMPDQPVEDEVTLRRRREEEDERQKRMQTIFQKYGASSSAGYAAKKTKEVDEPDVLRLG
eukprot:TRINITY_DN112223_c0_g1_i1.p1 TRINITY_DN112223_c0_g1~~TRINITY_DN112223_c0_g1_i1.p1  ORF type:complete len:568 (-),score=132.16 TRINITY_DN112223_c0_g1_i1:215-1918(-)